MITRPEEPLADPWTAHALVEVIDELVALLGTPGGRPAVLGVDGRSAGGKSTLAQRLARAVPGSVVVHSDDVAWWESFFGWDHLMAAGVLEPVHRGEPVRFRPPAWDVRGREGAIEVPAGARLVIVEGVAVTRRSLAGLLDAAVWVQSDVVEARRRGLARDALTGGTEAFWDEWDAEEIEVLAQDRPWERADLVLCGTPDVTGIAHDPATDVLVGRSLRP